MSYSVSFESLNCCSYFSYVLYFAGYMNCCCFYLSLDFLSFFLYYSHAQSPSKRHYDKMCISHIAYASYASYLPPFDNLLIYGQSLILLFRREYTQYNLQTPNELDSAVMPKFRIFPQGKTKLTKGFTLEEYARPYFF